MDALALAGDLIRAGSDDQPPGSRSESLVPSNSPLCWHICWQEADSLAELETYISL